MAIKINRTGSIGRGRAGVADDRAQNANIPVDQALRTNGDRKMDFLRIKQRLTKVRVSGAAWTVSCVNRMRRLIRQFALSAAVVCFLPVVTRGDNVSETMRGVEPQPFYEQARRLIEALEFLGAPLPADDKSAIAGALGTGKSGVPRVAAILDKHCLLLVHINPEMRVNVARGLAPAELLEHGWRVFLVRVDNDAGTTAALRITSPQARSYFLGGESLTPTAPVLRSPSDLAYGGSGTPTAQSEECWIDLQALDQQPMTRTLSGLQVEYRLIAIYSAAPGHREATLVCDVGQGTQDLGFRSEVPILFTCEPAQQITWRVKDESGKPTIASFVIQDGQGRSYPPQAKRLAPNFAFQPQVYLKDGETLLLPKGRYAVTFSRGPESIPERREIVVDDEPTQFQFQVRRWIDPSLKGWWSGDHHIHGAGCLHYSRPTEGVSPQDMIRQTTGEDLKIGASLIWAPGFDYQSHFFCGSTDAVSLHPYLLRYDVEISGFSSDRCGHLGLLRLHQLNYPGSHSTKGWPTLALNTLRWAKLQGAVTGFVHSGWGLAITDGKLPSYQMPAFDGIGAMEYIVDVTHLVPGPGGQPEPAVDFLGVQDSPLLYELSIWYHTLNAGFVTRIGGETDFPCVYGERVGIGRTYVKLDGRLDYDAWCEGLKQGRSYVSDGKSHLIDFKVQATEVGAGRSEVHLDEPATVDISVNAAALLPETPNANWRTASSPDPANDRPYWDIERARIGTSRDVAVELIANGFPVAREVVTADGTPRNLQFKLKVDRSSWLALRILGSSHTNPIFVLVGGRPIRASRKSVAWCLQAVDQCWSQKSRFIQPSEMDDARTAYDHARKVYRQRLAECDTD